MPSMAGPRNSGMSLLSGGLQYVAAIREDTTVFLAGPAGARAPVAVKDLAKGLPKPAWRSVWWRHGTKGDMRSRFAMLRVRIAHQESGRRQERPLEWLLIEWPTSEAEPVHYWLSNLPPGTPHQQAPSTLPRCAGGSNATIRS